MTDLLDLLLAVLDAILKCLNSFLHGEGFVAADLALQLPEPLSILNRGPRLSTIVIMLLGTKDEATEGEPIERVHNDASHDDLLPSDTFRKLLAIGHRLLHFRQLRSDLRIDCECQVDHDGGLSDVVFLGALELADSFGTGEVDDLEVVHSHLVVLEQGVDADPDDTVRST